MENIQAWLENGLKCPVKETAFETAPTEREYCVWLDEISTITADGKIVGIVHNLTVEIYTKQSASPLHETFTKMLTEKGAIPEIYSEYNDDMRTYITAYAFYFYEKRSA